MEGSSAQHGGTAVRLWCAVRAEAHRTDRFAYPRSSEQDPDDSVPNRGGDVGDVPDATVERNTGGLSEHASESSDGHSSSAPVPCVEGQLIHRSRFNFLREAQIWHNSNAHHRSSRKNVRRSSAQRPACSLRSSPGDACRSSS